MKPNFEVPPLNKFWIAALILVGIGLLPGSGWAETWYVKSSRTKMTAKASARSKKVATLSAGTAVKILKKEKRFYKISAKGKRGWVFKFKLTKKKPRNAKKDDGLGSLFGNQRMAASESSSGSSIRGLSPISEKQAKSRGVTQDNIDSIKQMEEFSISEEELDQFLAEGRLREYAE